MLILGIETSCDETAAALMRIGTDHAELLAEEISSQTKLHEAYGGVVPELASREHLANLPLVVEKVMNTAGARMEDLAAIGVTQGPGLKGCLLMGVSYAKGLSLAHSVPLVGVNHIEGHLHSAMIEHPELRYPFLALIVSGGHTEIVEAQALGRYRVLSRTIDDAAGEAFDKSANLLGFPYPGGALLARLADQSGSGKIRFPIAMRESSDFSFSGLKTAIALKIREAGGGDARVPDAEKAALSAAIQEGIVESLCFKLAQSLKSTNLRQVAVTGGVSANKLLRRRIGAMPGVSSFFPGFSHCMDNGAMIALVAARRFQGGQRDGLDLPVHARWPLEELSPPGGARHA